MMGYTRVTIVTFRQLILLLSLLDSYKSAMEFRKYSFGNVSALRSDAIFPAHCGKNCPWITFFLALRIESCPEWC